MQDCMRTAFRKILTSNTSKQPTVQLGHLQHQGIAASSTWRTMLTAQLQGGEADLVLSLQHLPHSQRRFAPLGVLSCSNICAGLLYKLGPSMEPHQRNFLQQYKVLLINHFLERYKVLDDLDLSQPVHLAALHPTMHHAIQSSHGTCCCSVHDTGQNCVSGKW